jgi:hypothetical protein
VTLDGSPDLSGVATDGSHVLWLLTSTGLQYFAITAKDDTADTVTVTPNPAGTTTGRTWAIGGKRATIDSTTSRNLFTTAIASGWTVSLESNFSVSSAIALRATVGDFAIGPVRVRGDSASTHRVITQTANAGIFTGGTGMWIFSNLKFANSNATKTSAIALTPTGQHVAINCIFGDGTNTLLDGVLASGNPSLLLIDCQFVSCTSHGISWLGTGPLHARANLINGNGGAGITSTGTGRHALRTNIIHGNTGDGFNRSGAASASSTGTILIGNVIHANGGDGVDISAAGSTSFWAQIWNNQITGNGAYGIVGHALTDTFKGRIDHNNFGSGAGIANTSGAVSAFTQGANDLNVNPAYVNAAGGNFATGVSVRAEGFPDPARAMGAGQGGTVAYVDIGIQQQEVGGPAGNVNLLAGKI